MSVGQPIHGRGTAENPQNRFAPTAYERDAEWNEPDDPAPKTQFYRDVSASIITYNDSPDVGFTASINPYRGCEHGCMCCLIIPSMDSPAGDSLTGYILQVFIVRLLYRRYCIRLLVALRNM